MTVAAVEPAGLGPWPDGFEPFTLSHALTSGLWIALAVVYLVAACRGRNAGREPALRHALVGAMVVSQTLTIAYWAEPARFAWSSSLPLHMCDIVAWLVPLALVVKNRWLRAVVFFWGLGLTTQAFVQPTLLHGPQHGVYWFFWAQHTGILLGGLYLWAVLGYRPTRGDFGFVAGLSAIAGLATAVLNWQTGWEYFFTGPGTPENETILDHLGPWPARVVVMWLLSVAIMAALWGLSIVAARVIPGRDRAVGEGPARATT